jgi:hypothetical protein
VHYIGVILAHKYVSGPTHIGRQLINFVKSTINNMSAEVGVAEIANDEIVSFAFRIFVVLQVNTANPKSIRLQALN